MSFAIVTDSSCNLPDELIERHGLHILPLRFMVDDVQYQSYLRGQRTDLKQFYTMMREGKVITTSLPNVSDSHDLLESLIGEGLDILYIKPVMHMDDEGHLVPVSKVKGRKRSINALFNHMKASYDHSVENQHIGITHGDCIEDAEILRDMILEEFQVRDIIINYVDPVIGAHSGPGTLALFFLGRSRD